MERLRNSCSLKQKLAIHRSHVQVLAGQHRVVVLGKLVAPVCLSMSVIKQHNLVSVKRQRCSSAGKVTAGLVESNGSLLPDL